MLNTRSIAVHTLGCKLNFSEGSTITRQFTNIGFKKKDFNEGADLFIINTCSVTENADKECKKLIRKAKDISPESTVVITGCFAQLKPKKISDIKGVDLVIGANEKFNIPDIIADIENKKNKKVYGCKIEDLSYKSAFSLTERSRSFLKIQDGCDYPCTYCTIPLARGKSRSNTIENILQEAKDIALSGTKEIVLTGVNIGDFKDPISNKRFIDLIKQLDKIEDIEQYRISSIEPNLISNDIIEFIKSSKKFSPHFHIPLQSGSDNILGRMKRRYNTKLYKERILNISESINNVCIGADVIVGFPGETNEDFNKTISFIKNLPLSYLHVFPYSTRENTEAKYHENQISNETKNKRSKELRTLSNKIKRNFINSQIGSVRHAIFEENEKDDHLYGTTDNYIKVKIPFQSHYERRKLKVQLNSIDQKGNVNCKII